MKALVVESSRGEVKLMISGTDFPEVGHYYTLEDAIEGTAAQNRTFHALTLEYFKSGHSSYNADNYGDFKNMIKRQLGAGFDGFVYVDFVEDFEKNNTHVKMFDAKKKEDIPIEILNDPYMKEMVRGKLKSWSDYTKKQRKNCIDNVITEMLATGVNTKKFEEILKGMNHDIL